MARLLEASEAGFEQAYTSLIAKRGVALDAAEHAAREVIAAVRAGGLEAVLAFTERFDGVRLDPERVIVREEEVDAAMAACPADLIEALTAAAARIRAFHERERPGDQMWDDAAGLRLGWRWTAVDAAGLYAPGGRAAYPSSVLMNAIPAQVAGVRRLVLATPPGMAESKPVILAAARIAGVTEIWRVGGAQAIAALAYGAGPLHAADVIAGPGNAYVAAAKRLVFGDVGIDSVAGPSEVFIVADASIEADWLAVDLLAQAEHDEDAQSVLFTNSRAHGEAVMAAVERHLGDLPARSPARASWERFGAVILVDRLEDAAPLVDAAAPEHLQIAAQSGFDLAARIRHAGAIFLGAYTPEALGDYIAGPNHVLPTGRRARFASGLSTATFMKRTTLIEAQPAGLAAIGGAAARIADAEGLVAHALSLRVRGTGS